MRSSSKSNFEEGPSGPEPSADGLALLDSAACGLLQTADDGTILRVNRTFCAWVGHTADALVGKRRFADLLTMGGRIFQQTHWSPLLRMQGSISEVKLDVVHSDGSTIPMVLNAIRREEGGVMVHDLAAFIARDRDKYERELVASRKRLEVLVREAERLHAEAKDRATFAEQMIGIVGHDLRNPLSSIAMAAALLARGELTPAQHRLLGNVDRSTKRANRLIGDLLDFTQARLGGGLAFELELVDLHETMRLAIDELRLIYSGRALEHIRIGEGKCQADAPRLTQLVGNLVSNAMVYGAPDDPVTLTSTVADTTVQIAVHNGGAPIPKSIQESLFEPMARGANANSAGRGVGLGLFIVREIAKGHGGSVRVRSEPGEGTTFTVSIPRQRA
jgi:phosphoserine phosphatase RsbU/P